MRGTSRLRSYTRKTKQATKYLGIKERKEGSKTFGETAEKSISLKDRKSGRLYKHEPADGHN